MFTRKCLHKGEFQVVLVYTEGLAFGLYDAVAKMRIFRSGSPYPYARRDVAFHTFVKVMWQHKVVEVSFESERVLAIEVGLRYL